MLGLALALAVALGAEPIPPDAATPDDDQVGLLAEPEGVSPCLTQPVLAVSAAGQVTFLKVIAGLSAP